MSRLPSYTHFTDAELLRECGQHYADGLIVELAKRLAEVADERDAFEADVERLQRQISGLEDEREEERERADNAELEVKRLEEQIQELEEGSEELRTLLQAADNQIFSLKGEVLDLKQGAL